MKMTECIRKLQGIERMEEAMVLEVGWNSKLSCWCRLCSIVVVAFDRTKVLRNYRQRAPPGTELKVGTCAKCLRNGNKTHVARAQARRPGMRRGAVDS